MDYQEKLRLAKEALDSGSYDKETIEYIFPELKESEDERIRKSIIEEFKVKAIGGYEDKFFRNGVRIKDAIAWLEKQGEQKPAWSEEDEKILHEIIRSVYDNVVNIGTVNKVRYIDWLKSLKERMKGK